MSYRDRDPRDDRSGNPEFERSRPDQYGQEHHGRRQYNPQHQGDAGPSGQSQFGHRQHGEWQPGQQRQDWAGSQDWRGQQGQEWQGRASRDTPSHSAFGESSQPRYFGTGSQGQGGGPTFTGGTYGQADWRSDSPTFDEVGFNRSNFENPPGREHDLRPQYRQSYSGRQQQRRYPQGPKGYTRSDERMQEDISERLMQSYDIDSSDVTVQVAGGKVVLEGTVPSRYMKHAIEDVADGAPGVQDVDNRIRVSSNRGWTGAADAGGSATNPGNATVSGNTGGSGITSSTASNAPNGGRTGRGES